jgi:zinc/manganese transport system permease protein
VGATLADFGNWRLTLDLLANAGIRRAVCAAAVLGLLSGVLGPFVVQRRMSFAVHATSELAVTGAAAALLAGWSLHTGSLFGALLSGLAIGLLGLKAVDRDMTYAVVLSFGLGLSVLLLSLHEGSAAHLSVLLTGGLASVTPEDLRLMITTATIVIVIVAFCRRPLWFASVDPASALARGIPVRSLSVGFTVLVAATSAIGMQVVGALLVLALVIAPAAAATQLTSSPGPLLVLTLVFAQLVAVGGVLLSLAPGLPPSSLITAGCFVLYILARLVGSVKRRGPAFE